MLPMVYIDIYSIMLIWRVSRLQVSDCFDNDDGNVDGIHI